MASIKKRETKNKGIVYDVRVEGGRDSKGKRKQIYKSFRTKKEAKAWANEQENLVNKGIEIDIESKNITIKEFVLEYLGAHKKKVSANTYVRYTQSAKYLIDGIGDLKLKSLTSKNIEDFVDRLYDNGMSESNLKKVLVQLNLMIKYATRWELLYKPVIIPEAPKFEEKEVEVWNKEQALEFLNFIEKETIYLPCYIAYETGLRAGEVAGLTWDDIDLENETINVNKAYKLNKLTNQYELSSLKTKASKRTIEMLPGTLKLLRLEKSKAELNKRIFGENYNLNNSVCCNAEGNTIKPDFIAKRFRVLADKYGYGDVTFHRLRHTHASILLANGINIKVIQKRLGHSRISTTLDTYSHLIQDMSRIEMSKVVNAF